MSVEKELKRKIRLRQEAIKNLGMYEEGEIEPQISDLIRLNDIYAEICRNIMQAEENWKVSTYNEIKSHRKILGKPIIFLKKVVRKVITVLLGWYINPIVERQSLFNASVLNVSYMTKDFVLEVKKMQQIIESQNKNNNKLMWFDNEIIRINRENARLSGEIARLSGEIARLSDEIAKMNANDNKEDDKLVKIEKLEETQRKLQLVQKYILDRLNVTCELDLLKGYSIDYFKFEDRFRGDREKVKESQKAYIKYFEKELDNGVVLDIGCGRGEFLENMYSNGIAAIGVDSYKPFTEYCCKRGFTAINEDALTYLNELEDCSLNGIFMAHVVEHLSNDYLLAIINVAYRKLKPGKFFILETPNPQSLLTYVDFYEDLGHIKPVHYNTLEYLFLEADYSNVQRFNNPHSKFKDIVTGIAGDNISNRDDFNYGMGNLNDWLSAYQDYTLIAQK